MKTIKQLLKAGKFDYICPEFENLFKTEPIRGKVEIRKFGKYMTSEEVIEELKKDNCVPANATELLSESQNKEWENKYVIGLGSVLSFEGVQRVPRVWWYDAGRNAGLYWFTHSWDDFYWFAFLRVAPQLESLKLSSVPKKKNALDRIASALERIAVQYEKHN